MIFQVIGIGGNNREIIGITNFGNLYRKKSKREKLNGFKGFDIGSIVGIYLNMWTGIIRFHLNRKFLKEVKFEKTKNNKNLFPIVMTESCCVVKLIFTESKRHSLFNLALNVLPENQISELPPGLKRFAKKWNVSEKKATDGKERTVFSWYLYDFSMRNRFRRSLSEKFELYVNEFENQNRSESLQIISDKYEIRNQPKIGCFIFSSIEMKERKYGDISD